MISIALVLRVLWIFNNFFIVLHLLTFNDYIGL